MTKKIKNIYVFKGRGGKEYNRFNKIFNDLAKQGKTIATKTGRKYYYILEY